MTSHQRSSSAAAQHYPSPHTSSPRRDTWPRDSSQQKLNTSTRPDLLLRQLLKLTTNPEPALPIGCRAIGATSWTHFTTDSNSSKPLGILKASDLCRASGTIAAYDPPADEWVYLGADQPLLPGKPDRRGSSPRFHRAHPLARSNTSSTQIPTPLASAPISFQRQRLRSISTVSELTKSLSDSSENSSRHDSGMVAMARKMGVLGMKAEDLPSAFDEDSEDDFID